MSKEMGPKERALREQREANFHNSKVRKPSVSDVRNKIAKIKPVTRHGGKRGR